MVKGGRLVGCAQHQRGREGEYLAVRLLDFLKDEIFAPFGERIRSLFHKEEHAPEETENFHSVSQYLADMEKALLELLEERPPKDRAITLWWGLDGLRLNENGSIETVSRRKQTPIQPISASMPGVYIQNMAVQNTIGGTINDLERELTNFWLQDLLAQAQKNNSSLTGCCCNFIG